MLAYVGQWDLFGHVLKSIKNIAKFEEPRNVLLRDTEVRGWGSLSLCPLPAKDGVERLAVMRWSRAGPDRRGMILRCNFCQVTQVLLGTSRVVARVHDRPKLLKVATSLGPR